MALKNIVIGQWTLTDKKDATDRMRLFVFLNIADQPIGTVVNKQRSFKMPIDINLYPVRGQLERAVVVRPLNLVVIRDSELGPQKRS